VDLGHCATQPPLSPPSALISPPAPADPSIPTWRHIGVQDALKTPDMSPCRVNWSGCAS
jgi:hypothetical protein